MSGVVLSFPRKSPLVEVLCRLVTIDGLGASINLTVPSAELDSQARPGSRLTLKKDGVEFFAELVALKPVWEGAHD